MLDMWYRAGDSINRIHNSHVRYYDTFCRQYLNLLDVEISYLILLLSLFLMKIIYKGQSTVWGNNFYKSHNELSGRAGLIVFTFVWLQNEWGPHCRIDDITNYLFLSSVKYKVTCTKRQIIEKREICTNKCLSYIPMQILSNLGCSNNFKNKS